MASRVGTWRSKNKLLTQKAAAAATFLWFVIHWLGKGRHGKTSPVWNGSLLKSKHLGNQVSTTHVCVNRVAIRIPVNYCFFKKTKYLFPFNLHSMLLQFVRYRFSYNTLFFISFSEAERFSANLEFWYNKNRLSNLYK